MHHVSPRYNSISHDAENSRRTALFPTIIRYQSLVPIVNLEYEILLSSISTRFVPTGPAHLNLEVLNGSKEKKISLYVREVDMGF